MKFRKDTKDGKQYLENLSAYIGMLNEYILASEKILDEHPEEKSNVSSATFNAVLEGLKVQSKNAQEIYDSANSGKSIFSGAFDALYEGNEVIKTFSRTAVKVLSSSIENVDSEDNHTLAMARELSILENLNVEIYKRYAPVMIAPEMDFEPEEMPEETMESLLSGKKPEQGKSLGKQTQQKAVTTAFRREYIEEFKRLSDELAGTDPWYSKGSPAYQALRNSLDGFNNRLAACTPESFDKEFRAVLNQFNNLASDYRTAHSGVKLDARQMKRLRIMNRFYMLGEKFDNIKINPAKDYEQKIAEKYVHAEATERLKRNPDDAEAKNILLYPVLLTKKVSEQVSKEAFRNSLPKSDTELQKLVKTGGRKMYGSLKSRIANEEASLKLIDQLNAKTASTQNTTEEPFDLQAILNQIARSENHGYPVEEDLSSRLTPKEKRQERMNAAPGGGLGTSDEVLSDPEMERLEEQMLSGSEFNYSPAIPHDIRLTNDVNELENFKEAHPELSDADKKYIDSHIATEKFYKKLEERKLTAEPKGAVTRNNGSIVLEHIHLDTKQTSNMGCYSCSEMLLLQSRGLFLDQRQIRNYRMENSSFLADPEEQERTRGDVMGNIVNIGGIATRCLKNTAVQERTYSQISTATPATKNKVAEDIRRTVLDSLTIHKSPVSVLKDGHYITVVGYNPGTDTLIYKNSLRDPDHITGTPFDPDKEHTMPLTGLLGANKLAIGHLMTIDPENPMKYFSDNKNLEYADGQYMENNAALMGKNTDIGNPDGKLVWNYKMLGDGVQDKCCIQSCTKVPKKLELTREMELNNGNKYKTLPLSQDPKKQILMNRIKEMEKQLFKDDDRIIVAGNLKLGKQKWSSLTFSCNGKMVSNDRVTSYLYLQKLKANIDILTPWQVENAFRQERFENAAAEEGLINNDAFKTLHALNFCTVKASDLAKQFIDEIRPPQQQKHTGNLQKEQPENTGNKQDKQQEEGKTVKNDFSLFK